jgi:signal transduction histidine kinase
VRIFIFLFALVTATLLGYGVTIRYFYRVEALFVELVDKDVAALEITDQMDSALSMQTALIMQTERPGDSRAGGDAGWQGEMKTYHDAFKDALRSARESASMEESRNLLDGVREEYFRFASCREKVLELYRSGDGEAGALLPEARARFLSIHNLCERLRGIHQQHIRKLKVKNQREATVIHWAASGILVGAVSCALVLGAILVRQVLGPIRRLALAVGPPPEKSRGEDAADISDEVNTLADRVHNLIEDADHTQAKLRLSREHLLRSEKLAMVGKLAAGAAHSIRTPLTSVKMRLFSLEHALELPPSQKEDFEVISDELRHVDNIVRNFLEFSRRPNLRIEKASPSNAVDMALQLLRHRFESSGVEIRRERPAQRPLPAVLADMEQLKEALVIILANACEALGARGAITIREEESAANSKDKKAIIRISDTGPGIPETIRDKLFEPFFTTKEEGTGLGLSIAMRIMEDHAGSLTVESSEGRGTTFTIALPIREKDDDGLHTDC